MTTELRVLPFSERYSAGSDGHIYSNGVRLRPWRNGPCGHYVVGLRTHGKTVRVLVHRIIATMFIGQAPFVGAEARHLNNDPTNNVPGNLAWGTHADNMADMVRHGRTNSRPHIIASRPRGDEHPLRRHPERVCRGERSPKAKLTEESARAILRRFASGERQSDLAREYGVTQQLISRMRRGLCWTHIDRGDGK
jgi:hypothetical protein